MSTKPVAKEVDTKRTSTMDATASKTVGILGAGQLGRMLALAGYPLGIRFLAWTPPEMFAAESHGKAIDHLQTGSLAQGTVERPTEDASRASLGDPLRDSQHPIAPLSDLYAFSPDDVASAHAFSKACDVLTFEWENIPIHLAKTLASRAYQVGDHKAGIQEAGNQKPDAHGNGANEADTGSSVPPGEGAGAANVGAPLDDGAPFYAGAPFYPGVKAVEATQDRLREKELFRELAIATPAFRALETEADLEKAARELGTTLIVKTRRLGYDGKGQRWVGNQGELEALLRRVREGEEDLKGCIVEAQVPFRRELSVIVARKADGERVVYPLVQNHHEEGILRVSLAPAPELSPSLREKAESYALRLAEHLDYVGVLALELFETADGRLLANEFAPRVHNSGHWTIEGAETSQFENHLRAICQMPLGRVKARGASAMINLIGDHAPAEELLRIPDAHLHLYSKTPRPKRKVGHLTLRKNTMDELRAALRGVARTYPELVPSRVFR